MLIIVVDILPSGVLEDPPAFLPNLENPGIISDIEVQPEIYRGIRCPGLPQLLDPPGPEINLFLEPDDNQYDCGDDQDCDKYQSHTGE